MPMMYEHCTKVLASLLVTSIIQMEPGRLIRDRLGFRDGELREYNAYFDFYQSTYTFTYTFTST